MRDFNFLASPGHPGKPLPPNARSHDPAEKNVCGQHLPVDASAPIPANPTEIQGGAFSGVPRKSSTAECDTGGFPGYSRMIPSSFSAGRSEPPGFVRTRQLMARLLPRIIRSLRQDPRRTDARAVLKEPDRCIWCSNVWKKIHGSLRSARGKEGPARKFSRSSPERSGANQSWKKRLPCFTRSTPGK